MATIHCDDGVLHIDKDSIVFLRNDKPLLHVMKAGEKHPVVKRKDDSFKIQDRRGLVEAINMFFPEKEHGNLHRLFRKKDGKRHGNKFNSKNGTKRRGNNHPSTKGAKQCSTTSKEST